MKSYCLSVRQPWAALIVAGIKTIENRKGLKNFRGLCYIHAAKTVDKRGFKWLEGNLDPEIYSNLEFHTGGIIGLVTITDCVQKSDSIWFTGPNGFVLKYPKQIDFYPCPGQLGFFRREVPF